MKIAIATDGNAVSQHFGRCPAFTVLTVENDRLVKEENVDNPGHNPGLIPQFLHDRGVTCIVAGGMGRRASDFFNQLGIETILGISGNVDEVVQRLLKGTLESRESLCKPGNGKGYGFEKEVCDHPDPQSD
jgi:predicted Fe-Mo cluster-binding NifX family protein